MKIDLHIHTTASDGELTPMEIVKKCNEEKLDIISITDHDICSGVKEAICNNRYESLKIIPGIELSAKYKNGQLHILGYNFDLDNKPLNDICSLIMQDNTNRIHSLITNLYDFYGFKFSDKDLEALFSRTGNIKRPDVAKLCVKYGYTNTVEEAFSNFFEPIKSKIVKKKVSLSPKECIDYILSANGTACIAHPITLKKDDNELKKYLIELQNYGASAIEVYHSKHQKEYANRLLKIANELKLLVSAGSDFHGEIVKPNVFLGRYNNDNVNIDDITILSKIMR